MDYIENVNEFNEEMTGQGQDNAWVDYAEGTEVPEVNPDSYLRAAAEGKILSVYTIQQQLNIVRRGKKEEIEAMGKFIDAVLVWRSGANPDFEGLEKIQP
ncbi:hypothetical protein HNO92_000964 [Chromobacterium alkanivorans]|uniref:hypothetical protein n=1 Tax=Chromobacterium alkanivorans TaxID=1071719 RepID=UPI002166F267|nr:hypothetical protein [Chromobacterium alkanivorans]MCS3803304.1 hypothetical protein [Chromobacterium alkanivorans]MCS3817586.1 hypothetical protein [Chromobacterium alkanivorans]MCS3872670.1 hypothetical protein [Chromobacterium alkanivorans]